MTIKVVCLETAAHAIDVEILATAHHEELGGSREFAADAVGKSCLQVYNDKRREHINCWIAYKDSAAIGYAGAHVIDSFYSYRQYTLLDMLYVLPAYRGSSAAYRLINAYDAWAEERGVEIAYVEVEHNVLNDDIAKIMHVFHRMGFAHRGYVAAKHRGLS